MKNLLSLPKPEVLPKTMLRVRTPKAKTKNGIGGAGGAIDGIKGAGGATLLAGLGSDVLGEGAPLGSTRILLFTSLMSTVA